MNDETKIMTLEQAKNWLVSLNSGAIVCVDTNLFDGKMLKELLLMIGKEALVLTVTNSDPNALILNGTCDVMGMTGLNISVSFYQEEDNLCLAFTFTFLPQTKWQLISGLNLLIQAPVFELKPDSLREAVSLWIDASLVAGNMVMDVNLDIPCYDGDWLLTEKTEIVHKVSVDSDSFETLFGNNSISQLLPNSLINWDSLYISGIRASFNPANLTCSLISVAITYDRTWKFFDNAFEISDITLELNARNLLCKDCSPSLDGELYGNLILDASQPPIQVGVVFPDAVVYGRLPELSAFTLNALFIKFNCPLPNGFPDITVSSFEFMIYTLDLGFSFHIGIDKPIPMVEPYIKLDSLFLSVEYQKNPDVGYDNCLGFFKSTLSIKDTKICLSAYYNGNDDGLKLNGSIQNIPIGHLIDYLSNELGIGDIPDCIKSMNLEDLEVTYDTGSHDFSFLCKGTIEIEGSNVTMQVTIKAIHQGNGKYTRKIEGYITISTSNNTEYKFDINFETSTSQASTFQCFVAGFSAPSDSKIILKDLIQPLSDDIASIIPDGFAIQLKSLYFALYKDLQSKTKFIFGVNISAAFSLSQIDIIGKVMPKEQALGLNNLQLLLVSDSMTVDQITAVNSIIPAEYFKLPSSKDILQGNQLPKAFYLFADLAIGEQIKTFNLTLGAQKPQYNMLVVSSSTVPTPKWFDIQKGLGPIYFSRLGVAYKNDRLYIDIDASLTISGFTLHLDGFCVSTLLHDFSPQFSIDGLSLDFRSGPLEIGGGFLRTQDPLDSSVTIYNGEAIIKTSAFSISGMGSYAYYHQQPSLFAFIMLNYPLGGPPYFFVTGLAGGFGYNRGLVMPSLDNLSSFPLVQGATTSPQSPSNPFYGKQQDTSSLLDVLNKYIPISIGEKWIAAGIQFTSFEILNSFALVTVLFGTEFEVALLGTSKLCFPQKINPTLVNATLAFEASFKPSVGTLLMQAKLTNDSYILTPDCHITGGFAFCLWFKPSNYAGDFIVTLGGYHPQFIPPSHYPVVPRLGFNWKIDSNISIKGGLYLALTPSCFMVGGDMEAVWELGPLKAWFNMGANFIISWKPYHYDAEMYINFGVSYTFRIKLLFISITKTLSFSLGADLHLWGPDFTGVARIHLYIISFTISFNNAPKEPPKFGWADFKTSFLPDKVTAPKKSDVCATKSAQICDGETEKTVCSIKLSDGMLKDMSSQSGGTDWIVSAENICIITDTVIPAKSHSITTDARTVPSADNWSWNTNFGIGMVKVESDNFLSEHSITLTCDQDISDVILNIKPILKNVPKALWEKRDAGFTEQATINDTLAGFEIRPVVLPGNQTPLMSKEVVGVEDSQKIPYGLWAAPEVATHDLFDQSKSMAILKQTISQSPLRNKIVDDLIQNGFSIDTPKDLSLLSDKAQDCLLCPPILRYLGEVKEDCGGAQNV